MYARDLIGEGPDRISDELGEWGPSRGAFPDISCLYLCTCFRFSSVYDLQRLIIWFLWHDLLDASRATGLTGT